MKTWRQIIENMNHQKVIRGWDTLYWCIDLHDVVISGKYNRYNNGAIIFPYAKETLDYLYTESGHKTILWTSSHEDAIKVVLDKFNLNFHYVNCNPECPSDNLCDFQHKFYFNFLLDDKAGFDANNDWKEIYQALTTPKLKMRKNLMEDIYA